MDTHSGQSLGEGGLDIRQPGNEVPISVPAQRGTPPGDLVDAIFSDDVERCRQLLDAHPALLNAPLGHQGYLRTDREDSAWPYTGGDTGYQGITPLVFASLVPRFREPQLDSRALSSSGLAIIELLVGRGASLDSRPGGAYWQDALFHETCHDYDSPEAMELLARAGADYHTKMLNEHEHSVLQAAAARGAVRTVAFLLDRGVPMHHIHQDNNDRANGTPLHAAATNGRCDVVRLLLDRGAGSDLETLDWCGRTPLLCASRGPSSDEVDAKRGSWEETVRLLVDAGADLTALDQRHLDWSPYYDREAFPDTPLGHVSTWGSGDMVRYLADRGADIHRPCSYPKEKSSAYVAAGDNVTPLHRAALSWNADAVQALLDLGADPAASDEYGRQAQHWAAMGKCVSEWPAGVEFSFDWGHVLVDPAQKTTLLKRLTAMESTISRLLCEATGSRRALGRQDAFGRTPLHYAAYVKLVGAVVLLLEAGGGGGVDVVGQADNEGRTVLHHLVDTLLYRPHLEPVDGDLADERLGVALTTYIRDRQEHDIVDRTDHSGFTALHIAARAASPNAVALLLRLGADPNARVVAKNGGGGGDDDHKDDDEVGSTALHLAMRCPVWVSRGAYAPEDFEPWKARAARIRELLLAAGADAGICDGRGRTAAQVEAAVDEELRRKRAEYLVSSAERARDRALNPRGRGWAGRRPVPGPGPGDGGARQGPHGSGVGRGRGL